MDVFRTPEPWLPTLRKPQVLRAEGSSLSITSVDKASLCEDFIRIVLVGRVQPFPQDCLSYWLVPPSNAATKLLWKTPFGSHVRR